MKFHCSSTASMRMRPLPSVMLVSTWKSDGVTSRMAQRTDCAQKRLNPSQFSQFDAQRFVASEVKATALPRPWSSPRFWQTS